MACANCSSGKDGQPTGCNSKGGCATGGCNRMNTYDWISTKKIRDVDNFDIVEVSFKSGSRKEFFTNPFYAHTITGDMVVVESGNGYDVGKVTLSGELVRLQMKKKKVDAKKVVHKIIRQANFRDLDKLQEARALERNTMHKARVISRNLNLDMKIGDVEYQGDKKKATFFYTADGRVDFRELIRALAKEFKVKIEMRQIGARQESARIGGIGSCGRELCCSTWLTDFKSVSTTAARYQNLAINQTKLSGQCGRLKCCLNYELDSYMDALQHFPKRADKLHTEVGVASLVKTDVFKGVMYYVYTTKQGRGKFYPLKIEKVKEILALNKEGQKPAELMNISDFIAEDEQDGINADDYSGGDLTGVIELPPEKRRRKKRKNRNRGKRDQRQSHENRRGADKRNSDKKDGAKRKPDHRAGKAKTGNNKNRRQGDKAKADVSKKNNSRNSNDKRNKPPEDGK